MRRAGQNPTDVEVLDIINKIDDDSGCLDFQVRVIIVIFKFLNQKQFSIEPVTDLII